MATATSRVDELVKDYLLFRGLTSTLKYLEVELKNDKEKGLRADKIVEQIQFYINNNDLMGLRDYWTSLNHRLFMRLEQHYMSSVRRLEVNILKLYVVTASQSNKQDKVVEFFEKMSQLADLQNQPEFREWFAFPFLKNPEENSTFSMYFNKQWQDTLLLSLHNFLSVILQAMPLPTLLNFEYDHKRMKALQEENSVLKDKLRNVCESGKTDLTKIEDPKSPNESLTLDFSSFSEDTSSTSNQEKQKGRRLPFNLLSKKKPEVTVTSTTKLEPTKPVKTKPKPVTAPVTSGKRPPLSSTPTRQTSVGPSSTGETTPKHKSHVEYEKQRKELLGIEKKPAVVEISTASESKGATLPIEMNRESSSPGIPESESPFLQLSQEEYGEHHSSVSYSRFSPSGQYIASLDVDGIVKLWTWSPQPATMSTVMVKSAFLSLEWVNNQSDRYLLLGNRSGRVRLYDVKDNKTVREVVVDTAYPRIINIASNPSGVSFVCSAGALRNITGTSDIPLGIKPGKLILWDVKTMKMEKQLVLDPYPVAINCSSFNHNGQLLVTGAADGVIRLFDIQQCKCISQWEAHEGEVNSVQFSSDETSCYSIGTDGKFIQWSIHNTGSKLTDLPIHSGACLPFLATSPTGNKELPRGRLFCFDSDGQYILTCDKNKSIIYEIDVDNGIKKSMELKGHKSSVTTVDWSLSNNTRVALSGAMDGKIKVSTLLPL